LSLNVDLEILEREKIVCRYRLGEKEKMEE
jgi:hypothetical protein